MTGEDVRVRPSFDDPGLAGALDALEDGEADLLDFGLITMDRVGLVVGYNAYESRRAGLGADRVLGRNFFTEVGPCTDNPVVAGRYRAARDGSGELDVEIDYVFAFRMRVAPVRLRLLAAAGSQRQYLAVRERA